MIQMYGEEHQACKYTGQDMRIVINILYTLIPNLFESKSLQRSFNICEIKHKKSFSRLLTITLLL